MPNFTQTGTGQYDYWLLDGGKAFSTIPANTLPSISVDMPIRLQVGNGYFGSTHITARHGKWLERYQPDGCVATFGEDPVIGGKKQDRVSSNAKSKLCFNPKKYWGFLFHNNSLLQEKRTGR